MIYDDELLKAIESYEDEPYSDDDYLWLFEPNEWNEDEDALGFYTYLKEKKKFEKKYLTNNILRKEKNDKLYHFSELDTEFREILFYRVIDKNKTKYLIFETCSCNNRNSTNKYDTIKIKDFNSIADIFMSRNCYCWKLADNVAYGDQKEYSNIIELNEFVKYGIDNGIQKLNNFDIKTSYCGLEEIFYNNDILLFNYGKGRKLLDLENLNENTKVGDYYSHTLIVGSSDNQFSLLDLIQ